MKKSSMFLALLVSISLAATAAGPFYDPQPLVESVQAAIEQAVGAKASDRILGGYSYDSALPTTKQNTNRFQVGAIECPEAIANVGQATQLVITNIASTVTNVSEMSIQTVQPGGETLISFYVTNTDLSKPQRPQEHRLRVRIAIFKRSSGRVIILPNYFLPYSGGVG